VTRRLIIVLMLAAVAATLATFADGAPQRPSSGGRYVDPGGWSLTYPGGLYLEHADSGPGMAEFHEVTIASFPSQRGIESGKTSDGGYIRFVAPARPFPATGVALRIWSVIGPPVGDDGPDSRFPIELATLTKPDREIGLAGARDRVIVANGLVYTATVIIGPRAAPALRAALAGVLASLRFAAQHPGTTNGPGRQFVLQTPSHYPSGSFTLVHAPGEICGVSVDSCHNGIAPLYLVHADWRLARNVWRSPCGQPANRCVPMGSFYALGWRAQQVQGGYTSRCVMRVDRVHQQFYCANFDARWDLFGRTLHRPRWASVNDDLAVIPTKISWAGFVVLP
jgi:hypothetical protein